MTDDQRVLLSDRVVTSADVGYVTELFALAFHGDPTWGWVFPDESQRLGQLRKFWGLLLHTAVPYESVYLADDGGAATMWIPPGCPELSNDDEARVEPLLRELVGDRTDEVLELLSRFESTHPHEPEHFYLSLLGTHPDHRGAGKGMRLLANQLTVLDRRGIPTYLESSNRANDVRYQKLGYRQIGEFAVPDNSVTLACMWRDVP